MNSPITTLYQEFLKHPNVITDSRNVQKNALFFALKGDNFDGNKFALKAIEDGCSLAVVDDSKLKDNEKCFLVNDVLTTLQELAKHHRSRLNIPIIGITGTNGKTTTKELIFSVLSQKFNCLATKGNLNNHIGVPLSILSIQKDHQIAVIEMGANHMGEIDFLCQIAQPTHGIITNIGKAHLEGFGSFEGVIKAKTELYHFLAKNKSTAFVNADNQLLMDHCKELDKYSYGTKDADCIFENITANPYVEFDFNNISVKSHLIGTYNAENIMAAMCIGQYFEVDQKKIIKGVVNYIPKNQRSELIKTESNNIILDAYNANPSSMKQALENFQKMKVDNPLLILGDMFELGKYSKEEHKTIVQLILDLDFSEAILVGEEFENVCVGKKFLVFKTTKSAINHLKINPVSGKTILIKGSRGMKLESLLPHL